MVPLVAQIDALRQTVERQAEQLVNQAETIGRQAERVAGLELENGRLMARLAALAAPQQPVDAPTAPESPEPTAPWWRWIALLAPVLVTAGAVAVMLLALPR